MFSSKFSFTYVTALYIYAYGSWSQYCKSSKWVKEVANCSIVNMTMSNVLVQLGKYYT